MGFSLHKTSSMAHKVTTRFDIYGADAASFDAGSTDRAESYKVVLTFSMSAGSATNEGSTRKRARVSTKHPSRCDDAYRNRPGQRMSLVR